LLDNGNNLDNSDNLDNRNNLDNKAPKTYLPTKMKNRSHKVYMLKDIKEFLLCSFNTHGVV
jgi:hypothetical protein